MASSSKPAKVTSSYHRGRHCGPCFVGGKQQPRYDHFCALTNGEKWFMKQHASSDIPEDSCICCAHRREAKRHQSDPEYRRREIKGQSMLQHVCIWNAVLVPTDETQETIHEILNTGTHQSVKLCKTHYQQLYRQTHIHRPCAGCGAKPKFR